MKEEEEKKDELIFKGEHLVVSKDEYGWYEIQFLPNMTNILIPEDIAEEVLEDLKAMARCL